MSNPENLQKILDLVKTGSADQAEKSLASFLKKNRLDSLQKIAVSEIYLWLGNAQRALKILGLPSSLSEIENLSPEDRILLVRHADMMHYLGATYSAKSILQLHGEKFQDNNHEFRYWFTLGRLCLTQYNFKLAKTSFEKALSLSPEDELVLLGLSDAMEGLGDTQSALKLLNDFSPKSTKMLAIKEQIIGEFLVKDFCPDQAFVHFKKSLDLFGDEEQSKDKGYLHQWWACGLLDKNQKSEAIKHLHKARELIEASGGQSTALIAIGYLLWRAKAASFADLIRLYLNPTFSPYRACIDCTEGKSRYPHHPWIERHRISSSNDVVILNPINETVTLASSKQLGETFPGTLDLVNGALHTDAVTKELSEYRVYALRALVGVAADGINEYRLWDRIYRTTMWNMDADLDRLKKLIRELKAMGFAISKSKGLYFLDISCLPEKVIVPIPGNEI